MSDVVLRATTNYEKPGKAQSARDLEFAPPPWPLSADPRTPACTHGWDGTWGVAGERQYRCKHCERFIWHHLITDDEVPPFDPTAVVPTLRRRRTVRGDRR